MNRADEIRNERFYNRKTTVGKAVCDAIGFLLMAAFALSLSFL